MKELRIGIDLRALQTGHEFRGIGMHVRSVVSNIFALDYHIKHQLIFYAYDTTNPFDIIDLPKDYVPTVIIIKNPKPNPKASKETRAIRYIKEILLNHGPMLTYPKSWSLDAFLQFDQALGLPRKIGLKKILVVYDVIPLVFKKSYLPSLMQVIRRNGIKQGVITFANRVRYKSGLRVVRRANKILAISQATKDDIVKHVHIAPRKISVVYCGGPHVAKENPKDTKAIHPDNHSIAQSIIDDSLKIPFIIFAGGPEMPRRRIDHLVEAYHIVRSKGYRIRLVMSGRELGSIDTIPGFRAKHLLSQQSYKDDLFLLGFTSDEDLACLMKRALAFVFPTTYEGFGLPILESQVNNCPVIAYNNSSLPEVAPGVPLIEPSPLAIAKSIEKLLDGDSKYRESLIPNSDLVNTFNWKVTARNTLIAIESFWR